MTDSSNSPFTTPPALPDYNLANDKPWSAKGRFGRLSFLAWGLLLGIALDAIVLPLMFIFGGFHLIPTPNKPPSVGGGLALLLIPYLIFFYFSIILYIRRLHDLNKSGWLSLLFLVPLINLFFFIYVLFGKGTAGPNRFGPQRTTPQWEQALGWVSVAFMIIGLTVMGFIFSAVLSAVRNHAQLPLPVPTVSTQSISLDALKSLRPDPITVAKSDLPPNAA